MVGDILYFILIVGLGVIIGIFLGMYLGIKKFIIDYYIMSLFELYLGYNYRR